MSVQHVEALRKKIRQIGPWSGVRMMRNRGISFENAYYVMFGKEPRR